MIATRVLCELDIDAILSFSLAPNDPSWTKKALEQALNGALSGSYIALVGVDEVSGQVVGYAVASYLFDQADVQNIIVNQPYRGHGIGRSLLQALTQNLMHQGVQNIFLEVRASNRTAVKLYQSMGFVHIQKRRNYYPGVDGEREDALVFSLACL